MSAMASKATVVWLRDELRVHDNALLAEAAKRGAPISDEKLEAFKSGIQARFDDEARALFSTARLWDDGIIEPERTRDVLGLGLSTAANAPVDPTTFGVFRF